MRALTFCAWTKHLREGLVRELLGPWQEGCSDPGALAETFALQFLLSVEFYQSAVPASDVLSPPPWLALSKVRFF